MTDSPVPPGEASDSAEQFEVRLQKRARMLEQGVAPYPVSVGVTTTISDVRAKYPELEPEQATGERVGVAGRIVHMRVTGKLAFVSLQGGSGERLQAMISFGEVGEESYESLKDLVDLGDHLFVEGEVIASKRGELSIMASTWALASKACLLHLSPSSRDRSRSRMPSSAGKKNKRYSLLLLFCYSFFCLLHFLPLS